MIDPRAIILAAGFTLAGAAMDSHPHLCMVRHKESGSIVRPCEQIKHLIAEGWIQ